MIKIYPLTYQADTIYSSLVTCEKLFNLKRWGFKSIRLICLKVCYNISALEFKKKVRSLN